MINWNVVLAALQHKTTITTATPHSNKSPDTMILVLHIRYIYMFAHVICFGFNDNMLHQSLCQSFITVIDTCEQDCYTIQLPTQSHDCQQHQPSLYSRSVQDLSQKSACRSEMSRLVMWACLYVGSACHLTASMIAKLQNLPTTLRLHSRPALLFCRKIKSFQQIQMHTHSRNTMHSSSCNSCSCAINIACLLLSRSLNTNQNDTTSICFCIRCKDSSKLLSAQHSHLLTRAIGNHKNM